MDFEYRQSKIVEIYGKKRTVYRGHCHNCGDAIWRTKYKWRKYSQHYCTNDCVIQYRKKPGRQKQEAKLIPCATCGTPIKKRPYELRRSKSGNLFCSPKCSTTLNNSLHRTGENNPTWSGGKASYRERGLRHYGKQCQNVGCQLSLLGIDIPESMLDVHHIDTNRTNNHLSNLIVLCIYCHGLVTRGVINFAMMKIQNHPHGKKKCQKRKN